VNSVVMRGMTPGSRHVRALCLVLLIGCDGSKGTAEPEEFQVQFEVQNYLIAPVHITVDGSPYMSMFGGTVSTMIVSSRAQSLGWISAKPTDENNIPIPDDIVQQTIFDRRLRRHHRGVRVEAPGVDDQLTQVHPGRLLPPAAGDGVARVQRSVELHGLLDGLAESGVAQLSGEVRSAGSHPHRSSWSLSGAYRADRSITRRGGALRVVTRNPRRASTPTTHASTPSKSHETASALMTGWVGAIVRPGMVERSSPPIGA